jgi:putative ABC transport system ATP-binding protein
MTAFITAKETKAIACALASHPKIILADEPIAAFYEKLEQDAAEIMQRFAKEQDCTILLTTYDNRILDIADRIVYRKDGCLADRPDLAAIAQQRPFTNCSANSARAWES